MKRYSTEYFVKIAKQEISIQYVLKNELANPFYNCTTLNCILFVKKDILIFTQIR